MFEPVAGETHLVPVSTLMQRINEYCDFSYFGSPTEQLAMTLERKTQDRSFWGLVDLISEHGFGVPVLVRLEPNGTWTLRNGHHRLAAAVLLCLDEIPTHFFVGDTGRFSYNDSSPWSISDPPGLADVHTNASQPDLDVWANALGLRGFAKAVAA